MPATRQKSSVFDRDPSRILAGETLPVSFFEWRSERIYAVEPPGRAAAANILFSHGLTDHAARHLPTARWLASAGYRVVLFDLKGHGGQGQPVDDSWRIKEAYASREPARPVATELRGLRSEPAFSEAFKTRRFSVLKRTRMRDHLAQLEGIAGQLVASRRCEGGLPLVLMGHSVGGLLCAESAWRWRRRPLPDLRGVVLLNPALRPRARPGSALERAFVDAFWELRRSPVWFFPAWMPRAGLKRLLELDLPLDTTWGNPWLSDQADEVALYDRDPLTPLAVPSGYANSIETQMVATDRRTSPFPVDVLIALPGRDGITSVDGGLDFARRVPAAQLSLVRFGEVCAHDMMRSKARAAVRETVDSWIKRSLVAGRG